MKHTNFLSYGIAAFAVIGIFACFVGSTTDTLHTDTPKQSESVEVTSSAVITPPAAKRESCGCCTERKARIEKNIRQERERKSAPQRVGTNR